MPVRKPTFRRNISHHITNDLIFLPPPIPPVPTTSNSTNNSEHGSVNTSSVEKTTTKKNNIEDLGDQMVPKARRNTSNRAVIVHNGLDEYYRSSPDAPVFRYRSNNDNNNSHQRSEENSLPRQLDVIYID
ncbi:unnamed protein product [Rotaria sp. Silwood2]|nr:unnamed protein product [Rotaria sp. Silwood2]